MDGNRRSHSTFDPHGYQPLIIDEDCLSNEDCRQALIDAMQKPRDGLSFLTPQETQELEKKVQDSENRKSPYFYYGGESSETREKRFVAARLGVLRSYARDKYNQGQRIWYGDGIPFKQP